MNLASTFLGGPVHRALSKNRFLRPAIAFGVAAALATAGINAPRTISAQDARRGRSCNNDTLRGEYGFFVSGVRGAGPGVTESFIATGVRTYDGNGRFSDVSDSHGQVRGAARNLVANGVYQVSPNCSGTATLFFPTVPAPIEISFVVVGDGEEVKEVVLTPLPNFTATGRRK